MRTKYFLSNEVRIALKRSKKRRARAGIHK